MPGVWNLLRVVVSVDLFFSRSVLTRTGNYSECDGSSSILEIKEVTRTCIICEWFMKMWGVMKSSGDYVCASLRKERKEFKAKRRMRKRERERAEHAPLKCIGQTDGAGGKAATSLR